MIHCHEEDIDCDAESDEELRERIEDENGQSFTDPDPDPGAIPDAEDVDEPLGVPDESLLPLVIVFVVVQDRLLAADVDVRQVGGDAVDDLVQNAQILNNNL